MSTPDTDATSGWGCRPDIWRRLAVPDASHVDESSELTLRLRWLEDGLSTWSRAWSREALAVTARGLGVALLANMAALGLALLLDRWLHQSVFVLFMGAVTFSAWYGGLGPGLLATAWGALAVNYFWMQPVDALGLPSRGSAGLAVFALVALLISVLCVRLREARRSEAAARHAAEEAVRLGGGPTA
jgi:K+-sensing histidine kinase KdpD